jgi:enoyl-CoA hydratase/carnithine racemase
MSELVGYQRDGSAARITLQRPEKYNALTAAMVASLLDGVSRAAEDDDVKLVVVRGEGPAFCAGFDITDPADFQGGDAESLRARMNAIDTKAEWMRRLVSSAKPLVLSVHGLCIGIGTYLALVADFVVASADASFGLPEERFGSAGATWAYPFLIREVGLKRANEIVMTGRRYTADEFHTLGLITRVVPIDELELSTASLGDALASLPREGIALNRAVKAMSLATIGHLDSFTFHAGLHPHAERMRREADEFDFMAAVEELGMRSALAERERRFGGDWWGW